MHEHEKLTEEERELEMICKEIENSFWKHIPY